MIDLVERGPGRFAVPTAEEVAEWDRWNAYFTPTPVGQQAMQSLARLSPRRVVDLGAGAGGLVMCAKQVWPASRRLAVEVRESEQVHLVRHCDRVLIDDLGAAIPSVRAFGPDLVISNPPFPDALEWLQLALELRCWVLFLLRNSFGDEARVYDFLMANPPALELAIGGRPNMRPERSLSAAGHPQHGDFSAHKWLIWAPMGHVRGRAAPGWTPRLPLPRLPGPLLGWTERPGTELVVPATLGEDLVVDACELLPLGRGGRR